MAITQKPTLTPGPFDNKASKTVGTMSATITRSEVNPGVPLLFNTEGVWRDERDETLHVHANMESIPGGRSHAIVFELKNKNAPSGTYTVGAGDDVVLLAYFIRESLGLPSIRYDAISGEIQLTNNQHLEHISGKLSFITQRRDGLAFHVSAGQFDIKGIN